MIRLNAICFALGLALTLSFAPFNFFFVAPFAIAGFYYFAVDGSRSGKLEVFTRSTFFGLGHYLSSLYWISAPLFVDIKSYYFMLPFSLIALPLVMSLFISIPSVISYHFAPNSRAFRIILFALLVVLMELIRTFIIPFPWNLLGYSSDGFLPLMQFSKFVTMHGLSFFIIFFGLGIFSRIKWLYTTCVFLLLGVIIMGLELADNAYTQGSPQSRWEVPLNVRIVQPNSGYFIKDTYEEREQKLYELLELMAKGLPKENDLIVLPEGSIPFNLLSLDDPVLEMLKDFAEIYETHIIAAASFSDRSFEGSDAGNVRYYNMAFLINKSGVKDVYSKNILVPFGEYVPLRKFLGKAINPVVLEYEGFQPGVERKYFDVLGRKFFVSICFESIFGHFFSTTPDSYIVNLTNDSWLGRSVGPYQHLSMSKFRAVESNSYLIRAANTGISALISPSGKVIRSTEIFEKAVVDVAIP